MKTDIGETDPSSAAAAQPVCPSVLTPAEVIQTYGDVRWEEFTLEYLGAEAPAYAFIEPKGGAGDKGRDIVAHTVAPPASGPIDIFQCKAYRSALIPSEIWVELGKLCVFTHRGDYPIPRKYLFVAPNAVRRFHAAWAEIRWNNSISSALAMRATGVPHRWTLALFGQ